MDQINLLTRFSPINVIWGDPAQGSITNLANEIRTSVTDFIKSSVPIPDQDLDFMQYPCKDLDEYLLHNVLPDLNLFKRPLSRFTFKSPLNFIMAETDFHEFYKTFYHAKTLIKYTTNFITDSAFSLHNLHTNIRMQGDNLKSIDKQRKLAVAESMRKSFKIEKDNAMELLLKYEELIEYDQLDCSLEADWGFSCWFRSYGCSILSLVLIAIVSLTSFKAGIMIKRHTTALL